MSENKKSLKEKLTASVVSALLSGSALLLLLAQLLLSSQTELKNLGGGLDLFKTATSSAIEVGSSSTLVIATTTHRSYLAIVNDSANVVYLMFDDRPAVLNKGMRLNANGGSFEVNDENLYKGAIRAIASGPSTTTVFEAY